LQERNGCMMIFCANCIQFFWDQNRAASCPLLCNNPHFIRVRTIKSLNISCKNKVNGCNEVLNLDNFASHEVECMFERIKCRANNCNVILLKNKMRVHESECLHIQVECPQCKQAIQKSGLNTHDCTQLLITLLKEKNKKLSSTESAAKYMKEEIKRLEEEDKKTRLVLEQKMKEAKEESEKVRESMNAAGQLIEDMILNKDIGIRNQNPGIDNNQILIYVEREEEKEKIPDQMNEKVKSEVHGHEREKHNKVKENKNEVDVKKIMKENRKESDNKIDKKDKGNLIKDSDKEEKNIDSLIVAFFKSKSRSDHGEESESEGEEGDKAQNPNLHGVANLANKKLVK